MIKTEGFSSDNVESLASMITNFLSKYKEEQIINVQYSAFNTISGGSSIIISSPRVTELVVYKED